MLSGLRALRAAASPDDWVLVHDAARPCLDGADLRALIEALDRGAGGAVLAAPIVDTVKRESGGVGERDRRSDRTLARADAAGVRARRPRACVEDARAGASP